MVGRSCLYQCRLQFSSYSKKSKKHVCTLEILWGHLLMCMCPSFVDCTFQQSPVNKGKKTKNTNLSGVKVWDTSPAKHPRPTKVLTVHCGNRLWMWITELRTVAAVSTTYIFTNLLYFQILQLATNLKEILWLFLTRMSPFSSKNWRL
jgi:hypothetical protein